MFKYKNGLLPPVMTELYLRNNEIHNYDTRNYNKIPIASETETLSHVSARISNALTSEINANTSISKSLKYTKYNFLLTIY